MSDQFQGFVVPLNLLVLDFIPLIFWDNLVIFVEQQLISLCDDLQTLGIY